jgi:ABC-type uncharacterized transport system fused permease/ATPase subunit
VKKEASWLIPIPVPNKKEILAAKNLALLKSGTQLSDSVTSRKLRSCLRHAHENSELIALVSGDEEKRKKLATKYKVKHGKIFASVESRSMLIGAAGFLFIRWCVAD